jgi:hypothetical protein
MSLNSRLAIPAPVRRRVGANGGPSRVARMLLSAGVALATTMAVMLVSAVGLALGLN